MRSQLQAQYRELRLRDIENKIQANKMKIVDLIKENIFMIRFDFLREKTLRTPAEEILISLLKKRENKIKNVKLLYNEAKQRNVSLNQWGVHSNLISMQQKIRIMSDIVVLSQEKNMLSEFYGDPNFVKVGEIEFKLNYPLRVSEKYGSIEDNDYFTRRMRIQFDQFVTCLNALEEDLKVSEDIAELMIPFVTKQLGHSAWLIYSKSRYLRRNQLKQTKEFDPQPENIKPIIESSCRSIKHTKMGKFVLAQSTASKHIEAQIPISESDQFGSLDQIQIPLQHITRFAQIHIRNSSRSILLAAKAAHHRKIQTNYKLAQTGKITVRKKLKEDEKRIDENDDYSQVESQLVIDGQKIRSNMLVTEQSQDNNGTFAASIKSDQCTGQSQLVANEQEDSDRFKSVITNFQLKKKLEMEEKQRDDQFKLMQIQNQVIQAEQLEKLKGNDQPKKSNWLMKIQKEILEKKEREEEERREKQYRLQRLIDEDDYEEENLFQGKILSGKNLLNYLQKIEDHLQSEEKVISAWKINDQEAL